ncbi:MAG TPA: MFS transporter [Blastocatellia bacterium]|nr:MFS transporter [Blastocatellia bacterium]
MAKSAEKITLAIEDHAVEDSPEHPSAWSPLRISIFRALWIASVASYIGTWMQDVGEAWLMTSLTSSPALVALVETAGSLPVVLVGLPAGALADVVDRRRLLLVMQSWMFLTAGAMGLLALLGYMTPSRLLLMTFLLGIGSAISNPVWQAITPELVPSSDLAAAIALGSVGINIARAVGPALGGLIIAASGPWAVFFLNAVSFIAVVAVIYRWRPAPRESRLPPEDIIGAMRAGTRYLRHSPALQTVLLRSGVFIVCASALWALLAQQARRGLGLGSFGYGLLLGCIGIGAVVGAWSLPKFRERLSNNNVVVLATIVFSLATISLAYVRSFGLLAIALAVGGVAWISVLSSLNVSAQTVTPSWVRARVMAVYLLIFTGGLAAGSAVWGFVAARVGVSAALLFAAVGLLLGVAATWRNRLVGQDNLSLTPSMHWPEPIVLIDPQPEEGPAVTYLEYRIDPNRADDFLQAMKEMRRIRQRDGAIRWNLLRDTAEPNRYIEIFVTDSWVDHLRQHERVTAEDRAVEERALAFHLGPEPPKITHLIAEQLPN